MLASFIALLIAAGAPGRAPSLHDALHTINAATWREWAGLVFIIVITGVALHPIQTPLIQLLEGYWHSLPLGAMATERALQRHAAIYSQFVHDERDHAAGGSTTYAQASSAAT